MIVSAKFAIGEKELEVKLCRDDACIDLAHTLAYFAQGALPEPELCHVLFKVLKPGDFVVDAGANIGLFTVMMAKLAGVSGRVLAIEPNPTSVAKLKNNIAVNELNNVEIYEGALWHKGIQGKMRGSDGTAWFDPRLDSVSISAVPYDFLLSAFRWHDPRLVKMDIEGAEVAAVIGGSRLRNCPYIVSEVNEVALNRAGRSVEELIARFGNLGKKPFILDRNGGLPALLHDGIKLNLPYQNTNLLFSTIPDVVKAWPEVTP